MKFSALILALAVTSCAGETSPASSAQTASGGTSSGGDQPFSFAMECSDDQNSIKVMLTDTSLGLGTIMIETSVNGSSRAVEVTSHLFRNPAGSDGAGEFLVRYKPASDPDVYVLMDIEIENSSVGDPKSYAAHLYGYEGLPVTTHVALKCKVAAN